MASSPRCCYVFLPRWEVPLPGPGGGPKRPAPRSGAVHLRGGQGPGAGLPSSSRVTRQPRFWAHFSRWTCSSSAFPRPPGLVLKPRAATNGSRGQVVPLCFGFRSLVQRRGFWHGYMQGHVGSTSFTLAAERPCNTYHSSARWAHRCFFADARRPFGRRYHRHLRLAGTASAWIGHGFHDELYT